MEQGREMGNKQGNNSSSLFKDSQRIGPSGKPERYSEDSLTKSLIGKAVSITLLNNQTVAGRLKDVGMYDISVEVNKTIELEISGKRIMKDQPTIVIIQKGALATLAVV